MKQFVVTVSVTIFAFDEEDAKKVGQNYAEMAVNYRSIGASEVNVDKIEEKTE